MEDRVGWTRRRTLTLAASGLTVTLAGCSGDGDTESPENENSNENDGDGSGSTPIDPEDATETESATPTETEAQFSTEGNDSELIERAPEELVLEMSDLPGDNWENIEGAAIAGVETQSSGGFVREENRFDGILSVAALSENVEDSQELYNLINIQRITGNNTADESQQLNIAVDSQWSFTEYEPGDDEYEQGELHLLKFRDANGFGYIQWRVLGDTISISDIGTLGVTMHEKWR